MKKRITAILLTVIMVFSFCAMTVGATTHTVVKGDNLSKLAKQYLGSASRWKEIYEANRDIISDPNRIYVGQTLVIPDGKPDTPPDTPDTPPDTPDTPVDKYNDVPLKSVSLPDSDPDYYKELWAAEVYNYKMIRNYPTLYASQGWDDYQIAATNLLSYSPDALTDAQKTDLLNIKAAQDALVQLIPFSDGLNGEVLYIWGDDMPITTENVQSLFTIDSYDNSDFAPFLIPYLVADQSTAKGNLIITSGGGNNYRSNPVEAYPICPAFVEQGYNCFLLQRRVEPYNDDDIVMDLQRAIRYIRYHAEEWGLGGVDILGAAGFSGSAGNLRTLINKFYGNITPDQFDKNYKPDAIDAMNSDLDIAMFIYGGGPLETENPNIPHIFIAVGEDDMEAIFNNSLDMYRQLTSAENEERFRDVNPELHVYAQNGHGFGAGQEGTSSKLWIPSADLYMQKVMGKAEQIYTGEIPEEYTLQQTVIHQFNNEDIVVTACTNSTHSRYYFAYYALGSLQIVSGVLIGDQPVEPDYDSSGGFAALYGEHIAIWNLIDPTAWEPIQR